MKKVAIKALFALVLFTLAGTSGYGVTQADSVEKSAQIDHTVYAKKTVPGQGEW